MSDRNILQDIALNEAVNEAAPGLSNMAYKIQVWLVRLVMLVAAAVFAVSGCSDILEYFGLL